MRSVIKTTSKNQYKIESLLLQMTLNEKIGQLCQVMGDYGQVSEQLKQRIKQAEIGSIINETDPTTVKELQRIAVEESRLGIPLLIGRDVIHGFRTIFPIPLGMAASWSPELVQKSAAVSASEAASIGVNWTFSPMIDISRDPRWGRIAEGYGEDPILCSVLGSAMVKGYQGESLAAPDSIIACAKHFAGYGATESGRDYNTTNIPENELRNIYLRPFHAAVEAGVASFMSSFSDLDGVPASGNAFLMRQVLRDEWQFEGFVVSDWESISQLQIHGFTENERQSAYEACQAGIDMEMSSTTYRDHLADLLHSNTIEIAKIDLMVKRILAIKFALGLFTQPYAQPNTLPPLLSEAALAVATKSVENSAVLLKNDAVTLPLKLDCLADIALIGPLADDPYEQLGTWIFDAKPEDSITVRQALQQHCPKATNIHYAKGLATTRSEDQSGFKQAIAAAHRSQVVIMVVGEESILSGEAHSRTNLDLPGAQQQLLEAIDATGKPIVMLIMAGRPLVLAPVLPRVKALLFAWHPGTMAGPGLVRLLFGEAIPSAKLPLSFPRHVGQIPIYYNQKHTGKPAHEGNYVHMQDFPIRAPQTSLGMASTHLDCHFTPQFPFGFGLSYTRFQYEDLQLSKSVIYLSDQVNVSVKLSNTGDYDADEIVQLYIRDRVGSITRPVKELKQFQRVNLKVGQSKRVEFLLNSEELAFFGRNKTWAVEPGEFDVWVGESAETGLHASLTLVSS